jgi:hypothetical protein
MIVKDMTEESFSELIKNTVKITLDEYLEDIEAAISENFKNSIAEARNDYKRGNFITLEEISNV